MDWRPVRARALGPRPGRYPTGPLNAITDVPGVLVGHTALVEGTDIRSVNPVVGETNDGYLSDIRRRPITADHVLTAVRGARSGPVEEGRSAPSTRRSGWPVACRRSRRRWTRGTRA